MTTAKTSKKKRSKRRTPLLLVSLLALVGLTIDVVWQLTAPLPIAAAITFDVIPGSRFDRNLSKLYGLGYFRSARQGLYLAAYGRIGGAAAAIKAGEYALQPGLTPLGLLALWQSGKSVLHELRLIEGWRFSQAWTVINSSPDITHTLGLASAEQLMQALGRGDIAAEGRFFPDTYRFPKGMTDIAFLKNANSALEKILQSEWAQRAPDLPYESADQALIMASIVEKESARADEREQIAGVFLRRLKIGMRLQTDPTVIYGLGDAYDGDIRSRDLVRDTPYNTYTRGGLPPTPICLPSREAIHAALHPADGDTLYFVARGDGSHQFSATLDEHNAAVRRLLQKTGDKR